MVKHWPREFAEQVGLPKEELESASSETPNTQRYKTLSNLIRLWNWPYFEVGLDDLQKSLPA